VTGLDTGYYKYGWLYNGVDQDAAHARQGTSATSTTDDLPRFMTRIVHMAELSNDPIGDLIGEVTFDVNHKGTVHLAERAKEAGRRTVRLYVVVQRVRRRRRDRPTRAARFNPLTSYAKCKALVERDLFRHGRRRLLTVVSCANATAFGASPRHAVRQSC